MSAARLLASALVFGGFVLYGAVKKARRLNEAEQLRSIAADIAELAVKLEMTRAPLGSIAGALAQKSCLPRFWQELGEALEAGESPKGAYQKARQMIVCTEADGVLEELFSVLGAADAASEANKLKHAGARLEGILNESNRKAQESNRLTGSLCVLMGLAAALLLL